MTKSFSVDARAILTLGRDSIKDHTTALVELVKNSYDADATKVEVEVSVKSKSPFIRIADNGCGMTESDIDNNWLRIGFSEKTTERVSALNRRRTGEKGIGRISADRLGAILELYTKAKGKVYALRVDWNKFDVKGKDLATILIDEILNAVINIPRTSDEREPKSGTELIIKKLRQSWTEADIEALHRELSTLVSPFKSVNDFQVTINTDVAKGYSGAVDSEFYQTAEIRLDVEFYGESEVTYTITDREEQKGGNKKQHTLHWRDLVQRPAQSSHQNLRCGPVSLTLMFFPRKAEILSGTKFSLRDLRQFLNNNAGVSIYRDNIRVKPYGNPKEPEGDWLGLGTRLARNPAGAGRASFKVSPTQIVGAVFVSRDRNPLLIDSSSREGLIQGEAFNDLRALVIGCVTLLEAHYNKKFIEEKSKAKKVTSPSEEVKTLNKELRVLQKDLKSIAPMIAKNSSARMEHALEQVELVSDRIEQAQKSITELQSQASVYRGLATIGIAATVFGHETQSSISGFIGSVHTVNGLLKQSPPRVEEAIEEIDVAIEYADKVSAWGAFALTRIQRDKRRRTIVNIKSIADGIISELKPALDALNIIIEAKVCPVKGRTFAMDVEAVLINLLTNAYTACQQGRRRRIIRAEVKPSNEGDVAGFEIVVADSGPGVAKEFRERIWDPLFSTRTNAEGNQIGTGLGLAIIQSIVDDLHGVRRLDADPELKGARFSVWLPLA